MSEVKPKFNIGDKVRVLECEWNQRGEKTVIGNTYYIISKDGAPYLSMSKNGKITTSLYCNQNYLEPVEPATKETPVGFSIGVNLEIKGVKHALTYAEFNNLKNTINGMSL